MTHHPFKHLHQSPPNYKFTMLLSQRQKITLKDSSTTVLEVHAAYLDTYLLLVLDSETHKCALNHVGSKGVYLWQHLFEERVYQLQMIGDSQGAACFPKRSVIEVYDLNSHQIMSLNHMFVVENSPSTQLLYFSDRSLLCLVERDYEQGKLFVSYWESPLSEDSVEMVEYQSREQGQISQETVILKANNHSLIVVYEPLQESIISLILIDVVGMSGRFRPLSVPLTTSQDFEQTSNQLILIQSIWQLSQYSLLIVCEVTNDQAQRAQQEIDTKNLIFDMTQWTVDQINFIPVEIQWHLLDICHLGRYSCYLSQRHSNAKQNASNILIFNNQTGKMIHQQDEEETAGMRMSVGSDGATLLVTKQSGVKQSQMEVSRHRVIEWSEISLHWLLHLNSQFDDDLLKDAIELLHLNLRAQKVHDKQQ